MNVDVMIGKLFLWCFIVFSILNKLKFNFYQYKQNFIQRSSMDVVCKLIDLEVRSWLGNLEMMEQEVC